MVTEDAPNLTLADSKTWLKQQGYDETQSADAVLKDIQEVRKRTLSILEGLSEDQWKRIATFVHIGEITTTGLVPFLCSEDQMHLAHLQWLLGASDVV